MRQYSGYIKENPDGADRYLIIDVGILSKVVTLKYKNVFWKTNLFKGSSLTSELGWSRNNVLGRIGRKGRHGFSSLYIKIGHFIFI